MTLAAIMSVDTGAVYLLITILAGVVISTQAWIIKALVDVKGRLHRMEARANSDENQLTQQGNAIASLEQRKADRE